MPTGCFKILMETTAHLLERLVDTTVTATQFFPVFLCVEWGVLLKAICHPPSRRHRKTFNCDIEGGTTDDFLGGGMPIFPATPRELYIHLENRTFHMTPNLLGAQLLKMSRYFL